MPEEKKPLNYTGNSKKARESVEKDTPKKVVDKVIYGEVVQRKKPFGRRFAEVFTGDDVSSVGSYVFFDVFVPAAKTLISDMVSQGIERTLFGDSRPRSSSSRSVHTAYNRMSSSSGGYRREEPRTLSRQARSAHEFDEVVLSTRGEAEEVLDRLGLLIDKYDLATVSDLYDLLGITGSFVDEKWGWTDLRTANIRRVRQGYLLDLPRTVSVE